METIYLTIWEIEVNGRKDNFTTETHRIEEALAIYKKYYKSVHPDKAFNVDYIKVFTGINYIKEE